MNLGKLFLMFALVSVAFISCDKESDVISEKIDTISNTYNGSFVNGSFVGVGYNVTVTKVDDNTIKIQPQDSNGTSFEVNMSEKAGSYLVGDVATVAFTEAAGIYTLSYVKDAETFSGTN